VSLSGSSRRHARRYGNGITPSWTPERYFDRSASGSSAPPPPRSAHVRRTPPRAVSRSPGAASGSGSCWRCRSVPRLGGMKAFTSDDLENDTRREQQSPYQDCL